jgi:hypothetical protein
VSKQSLTHELKIWPQYFSRVADGSKTFEVRKNDRGFQPGDIVWLKEWDPAEEEVEDDFGSYTDTYTRTKGYTGKNLKFRIGYVLPIDAERVVFSLLPLEQT